MSSSHKITVSPTHELTKPEVRFSFGKNWRRFLRYLNEGRIGEAKKSLETMLEINSLSGKSFLDIGCGSGLFSLAAMRLGADKVHSFDFDPQSVACTRELKQRYFPHADNWCIEEASVLNKQYLVGVGQFDVVYSWGVLHHTGDMWQALDNVLPHVAANGRLFIALYNDQGLISRAWRIVKICYNRGFALRLPVVGIFGTYFVVGWLMKDLFVLRRNPLHRYREYKLPRGMSAWTDLLDWLGGYPFEVAKPEEILDFLRAHNFELLRIRTVGGRAGNNEFVVRKLA
jgi:2-polyprenyl-3-methyl-5-hydroxy-6-metoxy-1,4-benzoquinol methylase